MANVNDNKGWKALFNPVNVAAGTVLMILSCMTAWNSLQTYWDRQDEKLSPDQVTLIVEDELEFQGMRSDLLSLSNTFESTMQQHKEAEASQNSALLQSQAALTEYMEAFREERSATREERALLSYEVQSIKSIITDPNHPINANNNENVIKLREADAIQNTQHEAFEDAHLRFDQKDKEHDAAINELRQIYGL